MPLGVTDSVAGDPSMFGVSIGPPNHLIAENPTSSSTMYTTLGARSRALGGSNGTPVGLGVFVSVFLILPK